MVHREGVGKDAAAADPAVGRLDARRCRRTPPGRGSSRRCRCRSRPAQTRPPPPRPAPLDEPPGRWSGFHGLRAGGHGRSKLGPPSANSQVASLPSRMPPPALSRGDELGVGARHVVLAQLRMAGRADAGGLDDVLQRVGDAVQRPAPRARPSARARPLAPRPARPPRSAAESCAACRHARRCASSSALRHLDRRQLALVVEPVQLGDRQKRDIHFGHPRSLGHSTAPGPRQPWPERRSI